MVRHLTTLLMVVSFLLMVWIAAIQVQRPRASDPRPVRRAYAVRLVSAAGGVVLCLVGAGVGAALVSREAKREYRAEALRNLKSLVEGEDEA